METPVDFILQYLQYLNRWNKSASLESIIKSVKSEIDGTDGDSKKYWNNKQELINIALFEYEDTCTMTTDHIMNMEDIVRQCYADKREEKLKELLEIS
jgi:hypothetical protein